MDTKDILFQFTRDQQEMVAESLCKDITDMQDYEICEMLDTFIDMHCFNDCRTHDEDGY